MSTLAHVFTSLLLHAAHVFDSDRKSSPALRDSLSAPASERGDAGKAERACAECWPSAKPSSYCGRGPEEASESFVMKASEASLPLPPGPGCSGLAVGKSVEYVVPVTYTFPEESTAIAFPVSLWLPPR